VPVLLALVLVIATCLSSGIVDNNPEIYDNDKEN